MLKWPNEVPFTSEVIEKIRLGCSVALSKEFALSDLKIDIDDIITDHFVINFRTFMYGVAGEEQVVRWPATWVDALKLAHAPQWVLRRWPVRFEERRIKTYKTVCPHLMTENKNTHLTYLATGA